jgi:hypothetical protein
MATIFVRHDVKHFGNWKKAYDDFDAERRAMGVTGHGVYQTEGRHDNVTLYHHFDAMDAAKAFVNSDRLKQVMEQAGVIGEPEVWFTERA